MTILQKFKEEAANFSVKERLFILLAMLCGFLIGADYAIIRPVSNSVFIHAYTSSFFPYAWIATVPLNLLVVSLYNRYLPKFGCLKMLLCVASLIISGNLFCALFLKKFTPLAFFFYAWKEVYILLMYQQLWSVIHSTINLKRAKYLYGIIFGVGGMGGAVGSLVPGFFAVKMGSESLLFLTFPIYSLFILSFFFMLKYSGKEVQDLQTDERPAFWEGVKSLMQSRLLMLILLLVIFMQLSSSIIDYQFNHVLERTIPDKDLRTEYFGKVVGLINTTTLLLQFLGAFLLVQFLGLRGGHFTIPLILCCNAIGFLIFPVFGVITFSFITVKACDFSLFGIIKEMLYIPLKVEEKFRAKAIIDVFAYRTSKAAASGLILSLQFFTGAKILTFLSIGSILLFIMWSLLITFFFKKYTQKLFAT